MHLVATGVYDTSFITRPAGRAVAAEEQEEQEEGLEENHAEIGIMIRLCTLIMAHAE